MAEEIDPDEEMKKIKETGKWEQPPEWTDEDDEIFDEIQAEIAAEDAAKEAKKESGEA